jgi:hypothetical protein
LPAGIVRLSVSSASKNSPVTITRLLAASASSIASLISDKSVISAMSIVIGGTIISPLSPFPPFPVPGSGHAVTTKTIATIRNTILNFFIFNS